MSFEKKLRKTFECKNCEHYYENKKICTTCKNKSKWKYDPSWRWKYEKLHPED